MSKQPGILLYFDLLNTLEHLSNDELGEIAVNRATGINPEYLPITVQINNEQARYLIINGKKVEAATYLERIPAAKRDAYTLFYKARTLPATDPIALELYLKSAEVIFELGLVDLSVATEHNGNELIVCTID